MNSAPVLPSHLRRKAVIYIRQSTGHQVMSNQESQVLQLDTVPVNINETLRVRVY